MNHESGKKIIFYRYTLNWGYGTVCFMLQSKYFYLILSIQLGNNLDGWYNVDTISVESKSSVYKFSVCKNSWRHSHPGLKSVVAKCILAQQQHKTYGWFSHPPCHGGVGGGNYIASSRAPFRMNGKHTLHTNSRGMGGQTPYSNIKKFTFAIFE